MKKTIEKLLDETLVEIVMDKVWFWGCIIGAVTSGSLMIKVFIDALFV